MDFSVHGILHAIILEWGWHFLLQGIDPGIEPASLNVSCRQVLTTRTTWEAQIIEYRPSTLSDVNITKKSEGYQRIKDVRSEKQNL